MLFTGSWTASLSSPMAVGHRLCSVPYHVGSSNMAAGLIKMCNSRRQKKENLLARQKLLSYETPSQKWHANTFAIICWLEANHRSYPHSKGGITQGCEYQEMEIIWAIKTMLATVCDIFWFHSMNNNQVTRSHHPRSTIWNAHWLFQHAPVVRNLDRSQDLSLLQF